MFQCTRVKGRGQPKELTTCSSNAELPVLLTALQREYGAGEDSRPEAAFAVISICHSGNPGTPLSDCGLLGLAAADPVSGLFPARLTGCHLQMQGSLLSVCRAPRSAVPHHVRVHAAVSALAGAEISLKHAGCSTLWSMQLTGKNFSVHWTKKELPADMHVLQRASSSPEWTAVARRPMVVGHQPTVLAAVEDQPMGSATVRDKRDPGFNERRLPLRRPV
jgi:hypothetical protein